MNLRRPKKPVVAPSSQTPAMTTIGALKGKGSSHWMREPLPTVVAPSSHRREFHASQGAGLNNANDHSAPMARAVRPVR
jgi:hypothetical protein